MTVNLPDDLREFVHSAVGRGEFATESDVVCMGLRMLQEREKKHAQLKHDIQEGLDDIERGDVYGGEHVFQELRERSAAAPCET